eukprot:9967897-Alexandrium_andersonii.AAC.1
MCIRDRPALTPNNTRSELRPPSSQKCFRCSDRAAPEGQNQKDNTASVSYTHLRAHETSAHL